MQQRKPKAVERTEEAPELKGPVSTLWCGGTVRSRSIPGSGLALVLVLAEPMLLYTHGCGGDGGGVMGFILEVFLLPVYCISFPCIPTSPHYLLSITCVFVLLVYIPFAFPVFLARLFCVLMLPSCATEEAVLSTCQSENRVYAVSKWLTRFIMTCLGRTVLDVFIHLLSFSLLSVVLRSSQVIFISVARASKIFPQFSSRKYVRVRSSAIFELVTSTHTLLIAHEGSTSFSVFF